MGQSENKLGFFEEIKINEMSYNDTIKSLKGTFQCQFDVKKFEDILDNFKKFNDDKKITRFPLKTLKELLKEKKKDNNFDLIVQTKKQYFMYFKKYYKSHSSVYGPFADIFKNTEDYEELLKEQNNYLKYKNMIQYYKEEYNITSLSFSFRVDLAACIRLENNQSEWIKYLEDRFKEEFSVSEMVCGYNLEEKQKMFFELWKEKECENKSKKKKKTYYEKDDDDYNYNNYSYDNSISNNNYNNDDYEYKPHHTSSNSHRSNYNSTNYSNHSNSNQSKKTSNTKKKVKVIMCYSCKGKKLCPLCGNKINSTVSLGNLYAHSDCYNEGTCCLCNKKGAGNQVQSICSDCRKSSASKGLTGSARCFICRKLI